MKNAVFAGRREPRIFYAFLVFVWLNRVVITIVHPWAYDAMFFMQLGVFTAIFILMLVPMIYLLKLGKNETG